MGFNEFPGLPDRFTPPKSSSDSYDDHYGYDLSPEERALYHAHCFPEIEQIVLRVRDVRASLLGTTNLTRVYVLTNGRPEWLRELKDALQGDARREHLNQWEHIGTSRDLRLTGEQRHNSQALDMAVAQRAEVFIGNGVRHLVTCSLCLFVVGSGCRLILSLSFRACHLMLPCYARHKVAIGTRCVSGEGLEKSFNARLRPASLTKPRGERRDAHGKLESFFSDDCIMTRCYNVRMVVV